MPASTLRLAIRSALLAGAAALPLVSVAAQERPKLEFGIGWSALNINDIEFTAISDFFVTDVLDHQVNHDGEMNGYKLTGELSGLMPHNRGDWLASFGVRGFYSRFEDEQTTNCAFTADTDCIYFPLFDPGTADVSPDVSGGFFSDWATTVDREVVYWGASVELNLNRQTAAQVSLKDAAPPAPDPFQWRAGLGMRRLNQTSSLLSIDSGPTLDPVTYDEDLDTSYYGGYFGFSTWKPLSHGFRVKLGGEAGLYYSDTDYSGVYTATANLGGDVPIAQSLSLSESAPAFIGALNLSVERDFGAMTVSLFGEAEWISHVPKVLYNDFDRNGGPPFDITGTQDGTELGGGSALTYTVGAKLSVSLN